MAVFDFLKPPKRGAPASQIEQLEQQLVRVRTERSDLEKTLDGHSQRRAQMLLADVSEEHILETDRQADLSRLRLERLEVAEIAIIEQLAAARDGLDRSKRATELERAAGLIESKIGALDAAISSLAVAFNDLTGAVAFNDLTGAVPDDFALEKDFDFRIGSASPLDAVRAVVAYGLHAAAPDMFETTPQRTRTQRPACVEKGVRLHHFDGEKLTPYIPGIRGEESVQLNARVAADEIIVSRLRAAAARLRDSGDVKQAAE